ncbi:Major facilitator superfamily domain-containing protein 4B [Bagarius yarrelli]|uniref:Major facilitator superfamily domain-containing protein 4B n=1 Tax=Bagarius yarrelli TaxID=175774 RepID=A0A556U2I1_BAGYA|nr:Major facilitator superfamily domain-containing protein 4B [Bagarius yarrelli]
MQQGRRIKISNFSYKGSVWVPGLILVQQKLNSTPYLLNALSALFLSSLLISLIFAVIPLCYNVLQLAIAMAVSGLAMGIIDTIANIQLVVLYQKDSAIFLQALHFFIGFGALLPVPIAVFVLLYCEKLIPFCPNGPPHNLNKDELPMQTNTTECTAAEEQESGGHGDPLSCCLNDNLCKFPVSFLGIHILGGLVLFMTDGIVGAYAGFAYTYAVSPPISLNAKTAGYLPCIFWAAITGGRLMSIPLAYRFKPVYLLMFSLAGVIVTVLLLLIFYTSSIFLFVGTCLLGLFLSSIFPCMLAYTEDILDYKGCATPVIVTCAGMGEMVLQVVIGSIIQKEGSYSFLLCGMIAGCVGFALFFGLMLCHYFHLKGSVAHQHITDKQRAADVKALPIVYSYVSVGVKGPGEANERELKKRRVEPGKEAERREASRTKGMWL